MWDLLVTIGNIIVLPALLNMVLDKKLYVPRISSGVSLVGLALVIAGLIGGGFVLSPIVVAIIAVFWLFIFLFRGQPAGHHEAIVVPKVGAEIHKRPDA